MGAKTPSKTADFDKLSGNPLIINLLTQNCLKRRILRYIRPRKILSEIRQFFSTYFVKFSNNGSVFLFVMKFLCIFLLLEKKRLSLHKISCTQQSENKFSLHSFVLSLSTNKYRWGILKRKLWTRKYAACSSIVNAVYGIGEKVLVLKFVPYL